MISGLLITSLLCLNSVAPRFETEEGRGPCSALVISLLLIGSLLTANNFPVIFLLGVRLRAVPPLINHLKTNGVSAGELKGKTAPE
jgi:hypothetical protein